MRTPDVQVTVDEIQAADFATRVQEAAARGIVNVIRQSSLRQRKLNLGSPLAQRDHLHLLEAYGVSTAHAQTVDLNAESARTSGARPNFEALLKEIRDGAIGIVVFADYDRASRNQDDSNALFAALAATDGLLFVNGTIYDPRNPNHRMALGFQSVMAEFDNEQRTNRMAAARMAKARRLGFPLVLPSGLVWANPDDPEYVHRLHQAGLAYHLERLAEHHAVYERDGHRFYILPFPDADVYRSIELRFEWLLSEGSLAPVVARMDSDPEWPRPGLIPITRGRVFNPKQPMEWVPLLYRPDGKTPFVRGGINKWFLSPSFYGSYTFRSGIRARRNRTSSSIKPRVTTVTAELAFPGLRAPTDLPAVQFALKNLTHPWKRGEYAGPRNHALPLVRCSVPRPTGAPCGRKLVPAYSAEGRAYYSGECSARRHQTAIDRELLDPTVLQVVAEVFRPEVLTAAVTRIRLQLGAEASRRRELEREVSTLTGKAEYAAELAFEARQRGESDAELHWKELSENHRRMRQAKEAELKQLAQALTASKAVQEAEWASLLELATDVPALLARAAEHEGMTRRVMQSLIRGVSVRGIGRYLYFVEVHFPFGEPVARLALSQALQCRQPEAAYAAAQLGPWLDPAKQGAPEAIERVAAVTDTLNRHRRPTARLIATWTPDRVWTAAFQYDLLQMAGRRDGPYRSPEVLAAEIGAPEEVVLNVALGGHFGAACVMEGQVRFAPTPREVALAFPEAVRHAVAAQQGWPVEDTITLAELAATVDWDYQRIRHHVRTAQATDAAGRYYVRRSQAQPHTAVPAFDPQAATALDSATPLDARYWLALHELGRMYGVAWTNTAKRECPVLRPRTGVVGARSTYVWVPPEKVPRLFPGSPTVTVGQA
ncbi:MAG TPA: recombinase family protein [Gemmatimonadales bacterium]|nr:recombinase family protein [Gemmatimonadales bacterium]